MGFANGSSNFYRHYLIDKNSTLNITVEPIIGDPALLIKVSNDPAYPITADANTYHVRKDSSETDAEFFRIDPDWRYDQDIFCDRAGYATNGGNTLCTIYISVECSGACVYRVILQMEGRELLTAVQQSRNIPIYLTDDAYYTG